MQRAFRVVVLALATLVLAGAGLGGARSAEREVSIGYQLAYNPWKVAIKNGTFEEATGYRIHWRLFDSGAKVISALVLGDVQIALLGSAPLAAAVSRGIDVRLFWVVSDIADSEALVVREGTGIARPGDLRGKTVAVPFFSTSHFHLSVALEHFGIGPGEIRLVDLQPGPIASAWLQGDIDAAFVWYPALALIKETGRILVSSGELSALGRPNFDGLVVTPAFAEHHPDFLTRFVEVLDASHEAYRREPQAWTPDSPMVQAITELAGGKAQDVPEALALYRFPTLEEQVSCAWLGCDEDGGAARVLQSTAEFLEAHGQIDGVLPDYARFVTPEYARAALGRR